MATIDYNALLKPFLKLANVVALLGYLFNIIGMFLVYSDRPEAKIVHGIFHSFFLLFLFYLETDQEARLAKAFPFLYSFVGRGIFYVWLAWTTFQLHTLSIIGSIITCVIGVAYIALFVAKVVKPTTYQLKVAVGSTIVFLSVISIVIVIIVVKVNNNDRHHYNHDRYYKNWESSRSPPPNPYYKENRGDWFYNNGNIPYQTPSPVRPSAYTGRYYD